MSDPSPSRQSAQQDRWQILGASALGGTHVRSGAPNQDSWSSQATDHGTILAVADGHGGRRYVRSDRGSQLATRLATALGSELLAHSGRAQAAARALPERLLPAWRSAVLDDISAHPFTAEEAERAGADLAGDPLVAYGATLLCGFVGADGVSICQIGDGDAVVLTGAGVRHPVQGDARLVGNRTTSLCLPHAVGDFRFGDVPDSEAPALLLLSSDGYANSFADADWARPVLADLAAHLRAQDAAAVAAALPDWLADSARVGGDDVTVALAVHPARLAQSPTPGATGAASGTGSTDAATGPVNPATGTTGATGATGQDTGTAGPVGATRTGRLRLGWPVPAAGLAVLLVILLALWRPWAQPTGSAPVAGSTATTAPTAGQHPSSGGPDGLFSAMLGPLLGWLVPVDRSVATATPSASLPDPTGPGIPSTPGSPSTPASPSAPSTPHLPVRPTPTGNAR